MTIISLDREAGETHRGDTGVGRTFAPALGALGRLAQTFRAMRKARRNELALQSMSDHLLKDIGVVRGDIRARVRAQWPE